ncbi:hypothetical protein Trydic_g19755 [Trypoxylus dichotomus]
MVLAEELSEPLRRRRQAEYPLVSWSMIGPYFLEEGGAAVTVTANRYIEMLKIFVHIKFDEMYIENVWFKQDGGTAHSARHSLGVVRKMFPGRLINLRGDVEF